MATLKDFEPYVMLDVPGCPAPVARQALMLSVIDFCRRSRVWQSPLSVGTSAVGTALYALPAPTGAKVVALLDVTLDGLSMMKEGTFALDGDAVRLPDSLPAGRTIAVQAQLAPLPDATTLPDVLLDYAEGIASGTKYRLMMQPGKAWAQPDYAVAHKTLYDNAIADAMVRTETKGVVGATFAKPVRFGY